MLTNINDTTDAPKILVVEGKVDLRILICIMCDRKNYRPTRCKVASEALDALKDTSFDLMIVDLRMPDMSGTELIRRVRADAAHNHMPIMLMFEKQDEQIVIDAVNAGINRFIEKPFLFHPFIEIVATMLEKPEVY